MKKLTRNQWVAVTVALVVVGIFFTTGSMFGPFFGPEAQQISQIATQSANVSASDMQISEVSQTNSNKTMDSKADDSFSTSVAGFEKQDVVVGTGAEAVAGKLITVNYSGAFTDGKVFDSSYSRGVPFEFTLGAGQVIAGWDEGFDGMKVGGKRRLIIPAAFGYGPSGIPGVIPPNATLVFEVELLGVR
jgi:FKBP-type peptidyl-prolyl cis-trans isomerase